MYFHICYKINILNFYTNNNNIEVVAMVGATRAIIRVVVSRIKIIIRVYTNNNRKKNNIHKKLTIIIILEINNEKS